MSDSCDPMDPCQAPLSMGFSRQEYWSGLPFPFPEDLPDPGIKPWFPALQVNSLLSYEGRLWRTLGAGNSFMWTAVSPQLFWLNKSRNIWMKQINKQNIRICGGSTRFGEGRNLNNYICLMASDLKNQYQNISTIQVSLCFH